MLGLRTQEGSKFEKFFKLVQEQANRNDLVFFLDCGEDNEFEDESIFCQNLCGWLIPSSLSEKFNSEFLTNSEADNWSEFLSWAVWKDKNGSITIEFQKAENQLPYTDAEICKKGYDGSDNGYDIDRVLKTLEKQKRN